MSKPMKNIITSLLLLTSLTLLGCPNSENTNSNAGQTSYKASKEGLKSLYDDINSLIEDKSCEAHSDCATIALGARACGGPESYQAYAPRNTDVQKLKSLAQQLETLNKTYNKENQVMSICAMEIEPNVQCVQNQCEKVSGRNFIQ